MNAKVSPLMIEAVELCRKATTKSARQTAFEKLFGLISNGSGGAEEAFHAGATEVCGNGFVKDESGYAAACLQTIAMTQSIGLPVYQTKGVPQAILEAIKADPPLYYITLSALLILWHWTDKRFLAQYIVDIPGLVDEPLRILKENKETELLVPALSVLRNLTMFEASQPALAARPEFADIMIAILNDPNRAQLQLKATMALANIVGKDEKRSELLRANEHSLLGIVRILRAVLLKSGKDVPKIALDVEPEDTVEAWALYEPLLSLKYLAIPSKNRVLLKRAGLLTLLPLALEASLATNDSISAEHAINVLSQFAFDETLPEAEALEALCRAVLNQAETTTAEDAAYTGWRSAAREADGLLWTLSGEAEAVTHQIPVEPDESSVPMVMVSYSHAKQPLAKRVAGHLRASGFRVWLDTDKIRGNVMEAMAEAVQRSVAVVIIVSPEYRESPNCQREANFAAVSKKKIIPVLSSKGYVGEGWLALFLSPLMYYDLSGTDHQFEENMKTIVTKEMSEFTSATSTKQAMYVATRAKQRVELVTLQDATTWLEKHEGLKSLVPVFKAEEMDGVALSDLHQAWSTGRLSYADVKALLAIPTTGQLFRLKRELDKLYGA